MNSGRAAVAKQGLGLAAMVVVLVALMVWPAMAMAIQTAEDVRLGEGGGMASVRPLILAIETVKLVVLTAAIAMPPGIVLGWLLFRTDVWGGRAMMGLMGLALLVPMPLNAVAWLGSFGNAGRDQAIGGVAILVGLRGAAFVHAMAAIPWVVFLSGVGMMAVERELEESALLDLPAWRVAWTITLRRSVGAILGGFVAVVVLAAGDMTVTDILQVRTYAEEAYLQAPLGVGQGASAARVALPAMLVVGGLIVWAARSVLKADPARLPTAASRPRTWRLGRWRVPIGLAMWALVGTVTGLPIYGLLWRAGRVSAEGSGSTLDPKWSFSGLSGSLSRAWIDLTAPTVLGSPWEVLESRPVVGTLLWSAVAAVATVAIAWPLAYLAREKGPWRWVAAIVSAAALAAPGPIVGQALIRAYNLVGFVRDTPALLIFGYVLRTLPFALLVLWPSVRNVPKEHLEAASTDGLDGWGVARRVGLPLTRPALLAAWGVAFVLSVGELPVAYALSRPGYDPIARFVWGMLHTGVESRLAAIALILLAMMAGVGSVVGWLVVRALR